MRSLRCSAALAVAAAALLVPAAAARAQETTTSAPATPTTRPPAEEESGPAIGGRLRDPDGNPVEGVTIVVARDGEEIGTATSDASGEWRVDVPAPGTYQVTLDTGTLPEGLGLRDPDRQTLDRVRVRDGLKPALFALGERAHERASRVDRLLDLAVEGLRLGLILAVSSVGLSLVFGVTGLTNFAHGELVTFGALVAYLLSVSPVLGGVPLLVAAALAVVAGGLFGFAHERLLFRPLRRRGSGNVSLIVVTIGLGLFLRNLYLVMFGGSPRTYDEFTIQRSLDLGPVSPRPKDLVVMAICAGALVAVAVLLQRTRIGTAMRAVADSRELASATGIDVNLVILVTWTSAGALAALGGVMQGVSETLEWDMGFTLLLLMFAAVILGGIGTAYGPMVGGLVIGIASQLSTYWIVPRLRIAVALAVLIVAVIFRPQGILGRRERIG